MKLRYIFRKETPKTSEDNYKPKTSKDNDKFEFTDEPPITVKDETGKEHTVYRIRAKKDIIVNGIIVVHNGELGGFIEKEENLDYKSNAWISGNAIVFGEAKAYGDAWVHDRAMVYGEAQVFGEAVVAGDAKVYGKAKIHERAVVAGNAEVTGEAEVYGNAMVFGKAKVSGKSNIHERSMVYGKTKVCDREVAGDEKL